MTYRAIHTSIWKDEWFLDLSPQEKLLFIYLFSNEQTTVCGVYRIALKVIAFETGIDYQVVKDTLAKFEKDGKVHYQDGIIWIVNLRRYNDNGSPKLKIKIDRELSEIPDCELKREYHKYYSDNPEYPSDTLPIPNLTIQDNTIQDNTIQESLVVVVEENPQNNDEFNIFKAYEREMGIITPMLGDELKEIEKEYPAEWIEQAFKICNNQNIRKLSYLKGVLKKWKVDGYGTDNRRAPPGGNGHGPTETPAQKMVREERERLQKGLSP